MSQISTEIRSALWKYGRNGNIEFLSNWNRLEKEQPGVYKQIEQKEGYVCQDNEYEYRVGRNKYGLWLSRKPLNQSQQTEDKPPQRPPMIQQEQPTVSVNTNYEIAELKKRVSVLEDFITKLANSWVMNHTS